MTSPEAVTVQRATYADVAPLAPAARREQGADIANLKRPIDWFTCTVDGQLAGCIGLLRLGKRGRIRGWYVVPAYRGRGLGKMLLAYALRHAVTSGLKLVEMNTKLYPMMLRWGWQDTGIRYTMRAWFNGDGRKLVFPLKELPCAST
jgi:GNAT superfamily N-acetyltransferase